MIIFFLEELRMSPIQLHSYRFLFERENNAIHSIPLQYAEMKMRSLFLFDPRDIAVRFEEIDPKRFFKQKRHIEF